MYFQGAVSSKDSGQKHQFWGGSKSPNIGKLPEKDVWVKNTLDVQHPVGTHASACIFGVLPVLNGIGLFWTQMSACILYGVAQWRNTYRSRLVQDFIYIQLSHPLCTSFPFSSLYLRIRSSAVSQIARVLMVTSFSGWYLYTQPVMEWAWRTHWLMHHWDLCWSSWGLAGIPTAHQLTHL